MIRVLVLLYWVIFQSTLPRGERRLLPLLSRYCSIHFNPRSREGSDATGYSYNLYRLSISIHAPARGATVAFISHVDIKQFQSTLPRGERRQYSVCCRELSNFNPRSREGSDVPEPEVAGTKHQFQSTLPRGERQGQLPKSRHR